MSPSMHKTFTKLCNDETERREFSKLEIICSKFSDRTGIKLDVNTKSKRLRNSQMVEIKTFLSDPWVKGETRRQLDIILNCIIMENDIKNVFNPAKGENYTLTCMYYKRRKSGKKLSHLNFYLTFN